MATFFSLAGLAVNPAAHADGSSHLQDYYGRNTDSQTAQLFHNVESHHLPQGIADMQRGRYKDAWAHFDFILNYFPNHPQVLDLMGEVLIRWKRPERADEYFDRALKLFPNNGSTYVTRGVFYAKLGKRKGAIEQFNKALELDPNSANAHYNLGLVYADERDFERANLHAHEAYALGFPLPGLRNKLKRLGAWKEPAQTAGPGTQAQRPPSGDAAKD